MKVLPVLTTTTAMQLYQVLRQGALILIAILLAKSPMPAAGIGHYEWLIYIGYATTFFWISGLMQGLLTRYPQEEVRARRALLTESYLLTLFLTMGLVAVLMAGKGPFLLWLTGESRLEGYELFLLFLLLHHPSYLLEHFLLLGEKAKAIAWLGIVSFTLQVGGVALPPFLGYGLRESMLGLIGLGAVRHVWLVIYLFHHGQWSWDTRRVSGWVSLSIPLVLYALLGGLHQVFSNWLAGWRFEGDEYQFAVFRYGARELPFALALTTAVSTALLPRVASAPVASLAEVRRESTRLFHILFPLSILLVLTSHWWFPRVFSGEFSPSIPIFNIFLLLTISRPVLSRTILMGLQDNKSILAFSVIELAANVLLSWVLCIPYGLAGIALGTVLAFTLEKVMQCSYLYWRYNIGMAKYVDLRWFLIYTVLLTGALIFSFASDGHRL